MNRQGGSALVAVIVFTFLFTIIGSICWQAALYFIETSLCAVHRQEVASIAECLTLWGKEVYVLNYKQMPTNTPIVITCNSFAMEPIIIKYACVKLQRNDNKVTIIAEIESERGITCTSKKLFTVIDKQTT